jgi:hypothetical protein
MLIALQIVGERRQTELGVDVGEALHEECALVHPLLDGAEGMLDGLAPPVNNVGRASSLSAMRSSTASFSHRSMLRRVPDAHCGLSAQSWQARILA